MLTSFDDREINEIGIERNIEDNVSLLSGLAESCKLDGIVCSPHEIKIVKKFFKKEIITPGIRFHGDLKGDQRRVTTPKQAFKDGATAIVMGRSLVKGNIKKNIQKLVKDLK